MPELVPLSNDWQDEVLSRLSELTRLKQGWDGYGAPPVSAENGFFALGMLKAIYRSDAPAPQIVPGTDSDLQIEWHLAGTDIELHVQSPNRVHAWRKIDASPCEDEIELSDDFSAVARWIQELAESKRAASATAA